MDLFGHINNVAYFKYIQSARVNFLEEVGINTDNPENKLSFAVAHSNCQFRIPLFFPSTIKVVTVAEWVKNTSLQLDHKIFNAQGELAAEAKDVIVIFDYSTQTKAQISPEVRKRLGH